MSKGEVIERVIAQGDLARLTPEERVAYYTQVCDSLALNPLTRPFEYITLNGKMVLYARRDCTDQLRKRDKVSVTIASRELVEGVYVVTARATTPDGRADESIGAVNVEGLKGEMRANAFMKAETKSKRRVTLSICGLGFLDETETESIPGARVEAQPVQQLPAPEPAQATADLLPGGMTRKQHDDLVADYEEVGGDPVKLCDKYGVGCTEEIPVGELPAIVKAINRRRKENEAAAAVK